MDARYFQFELIGADLPRGNITARLPEGKWPEMMRHFVESCRRVCRVDGPPNVRFANESEFTFTRVGHDSFEVRPKAGAVSFVAWDGEWVPEHRNIYEYWKRTRQQ